MGAKEIGAFLTDLAVKRKLSASTQNQALNALVFLYRHVLRLELPDFDFRPARVGKRLPDVLSRNEVQKILENLHGEFYLMASLFYGSGLRLSECLRLRVKDIDFERNNIMVHNGNGDADRRTILPYLLKPHLKRQMEKAKIKLEENSLIKEFEGVTLSGALERKYLNAPKELAWQYIFPCRKLTIDPRSGKLKQHYLHQSLLQKAMKEALNKTTITKNVSCNTLRHSFATHLLEDGYDMHAVQELLGHKDVRTTMMYKHVLHRNKLNVRSPLDI